MRIKTIMTACLAVPALSVLCLLSSCSSEELTEKPSTGPQTLTLNLKPAGTRAAVYTDPGTKAENTINSVTIGIFGSDNNVKTIQEVPGSTTPKITTSQLAKGDIVLVAVNAKSGTFNGALTVSDFENKTLAIDDALPSAAGAVDPSKLPMFGTGVIAGSSPTFTASVDVYHMVAKITLKSLSVNFSTTGAYSAATFTPTEVFMYNVPDKLDFDFYPANTPTSYVYNYLTTPTNTPNYYNGLIGDASLKSYLGTGTLDASLKDKTLATTSNWGTAGTNLLYLYTMPNNSTKPTQLIIKGSFDPDGKGTTVPVYYPVNINYNSDNGNAAEGATPKQVYPNKNYIIDVTIQSKGSSDATTAIDPETATATITVKDFTTATQSNVFN